MRTKADYWTIIRYSGHRSQHQFVNPNLVSVMLIIVLLQPPYYGRIEEKISPAVIKNCVGGGVRGPRHLISLQVTSLVENRNAGL